MRHAIVVAIVVMGLAAEGRAQVPVEWGVKGGAGASEVPGFFNEYLDFVLGEPETDSALYGFSLGGFVGASLTPRYQIEVAVAFTRKGHVMAAGDDDMVTRVTLDYVDVSPTVRAFLNTRQPVKVYVFAGPTVSLRVDQRITQGGEPLTFGAEQAEYFGTNDPQCQ